MLKKQFVALLTAVFFAVPVFAEEHGGDVAVAQAYIKEIQAEEKAYVAAHDAAFFQGLAKGQHPRAAK